MKDSFKLSPPIDGHNFTVEGRYTPSQKESWGRHGGDPHLDSEFEITKLELGEYGDVTALIAENAWGWFEQIAKQCKELIEEGAEIKL